jgi:hypothetical protein
MATSTESERVMNTNVIAAGVVGFLLGGLTVSVAAELEEDDPRPPAHGSSHSTVVPGR